MREKTEKKKRKKRRGRRLVFCATFLGILYMAVFAYSQGTAPRTEEAFVAPFVVSDRWTETQPWALTLVNQWNPIATEESINLLPVSEEEFVDQRIYPSLQALLAQAKADGVFMTVVSGYRTNEVQQRLFDEKLDACKAKGMGEQRALEETQRWVAVPGTSEHALGIAVDLNGDGVETSGVEAYAWLAENAHDYGFIYRYPEDKIEITGIAKEPWHYRYVGKKVASQMYQQGICLEEYIQAQDRGQ